MIRFPDSVIYNLEAAKIQHSFNITFWVVSKSDQAPHKSVLKRRDDLIFLTKNHVTSASVHFNFWGAREILCAFRNPPNRTVALDIVEHLMREDGSIICLARLDRFAEFLTDDSGALREYILEPNVRDYQGRQNPVNKDIREALEVSTVKEFWWLNNGITILADKCHVAAGKVQIESPKLVNGLQTSHEIFSTFSQLKRDDGRTVLVRVILPPDDQTRRRIIKATNNQTTVSPLSLRATDDIHFDIEAVLKVNGIFYDRRKGEQRRLRRPVSKIMSIKELGQAVLAVALQRPNDARARPMSVLGNERGYCSVFDVKADTLLFLACALIYYEVVNYLKKNDSLDRDIRNDVRYYICMCLAAHLIGRATPSEAEITSLAKTVLKAPVQTAVLDQCCEDVMLIYRSFGKDANAAKGGEMITALKKKLVEDLECRRT